MKKTNKFISIILAVIMLLTAVPLQSFATFDLFHPIVVKVEPLDDMPISNKYIQYLDEDEFNFGIIPEYYNFQFKVYLSNGRSYIVDNLTYNGSDENSGIANTLVVFQILADYSAMLVAMDKDTIKVRTYVFVEYTDGHSAIFPFIVEKKLVSEIVDEVNFVGEMPDFINKYDPAAELIGEKFEIKYANGRKKKFALETRDDMYFLNDCPVYLSYIEDTYVDESTGELVYRDGLDVLYLDEFTMINEKFSEGPYNDFKITDCKFNGKGGLIEVTYKLTYKNGEEYERTCVFENPVTDNNYTEFVDEFDGNNISVYYNCSESNYYISAYIEYGVWKLYDSLENETSYACDCNCHKGGKFNFIVYDFVCTIWRVFGVKEECQCGAYHW